MSWTIKLKDDSIEYSFKEEYYQTEQIILVNSECYTEKSGGYKEPDDDVLCQTYEAESEHGTFSWKVRATRTGWDTYGDFDEIYESTEPEGCESLDSPSFDIEIIEDEDEF